MFDADAVGQDEEAGETLAQALVARGDIDEVGVAIGQVQMIAAVEGMLDQGERLVARHRRDRDAGDIAARRFGRRRGQPDAAKAEENDVHLDRCWRTHRHADGVGHCLRWDSPGVKRNPAIG